MIEGPVQYYVEGEDEKKLLNVLKTDLQCIVPGNIQVFNAASKTITKTRLLTLKPQTTVVLVFDVDVVNDDILKRNIDMIKEMPNVSDVLAVMQVNNLENELERACDLKKAEELFKARSKDEFKSKLIKSKNLATVLKNHKFDIKKMWIQPVPGKLLGLENAGKSIFISK